MAAHKHASMIKAKADNMELVVFCKGNGKWFECKCEFWQIAWWEDCEYFLCLPQHKEACLHWLNGGEIEWRDLSLSEDSEWNSKESHEDDEISRKYFIGNGFALDDNEFRIKPRKEKRWIAVHSKSAKVEMFFDEKVCDNCMSEPMYQGCQKIEIEVEI